MKKEYKFYEILDSDLLQYIRWADAVRIYLIDYQRKKCSLYNGIVQRKNNIHLILDLNMQTCRNLSQYFEFKFIVLEVFFFLKQWTLLIICIEKY